MNILSEVCQNRYLMREVGNRINDVIAVRPMEQVLEGSQ